MYRELLLVVHIASVAAWLGANFVQLFLGPWFTRRGGEAAIAWHEAATRLTSRYYNVAGAVLVLSGVLLVLELDHAWSAGFVGVGITVVIIGAALGILFFGPTARRLADAEREVDAAERRRLGRMYVALACVDTLLVLLAVLAMVKRWNA